jgi:hypothetical protein
MDKNKLTRANELTDIIACLESANDFIARTYLVPGEMYRMMLTVETKGTGHNGYFICVRLGIPDHIKEQIRQYYTNALAKALTEFDNL